ncbi:MAG: hypothetical protein IT581_04465 [Verrucomicrobiales bacterium]|nr:hypothetical protein [Verrucomicrobiales bacterium]
MSKKNGPSGREVEHGGQTHFEAKDRMARLGPYYLPKPYLQIYVYEAGLLGDRRPQVGYRTISVPDRSQPIYLEQNYTWASEDKVRVLFSEEGFLERVVYSREPKSADVAVAVGRAVASVLAPVPIPLPLKGAGDLPEFSRVLFTTNLPLNCDATVDETFTVRTATGRGEGALIQSQEIVDPRSLVRRLRRGYSLVADDDVERTTDLAKEILGITGARTTLRDYLRGEFPEWLKDLMLGPINRFEDLPRQASQALVDELNRLLEINDPAHEWPDRLQLGRGPLALNRRSNQEKRYLRRSLLAAEFPGLIKEIERPLDAEAYFAAGVSVSTRQLLARRLDPVNGPSRQTLAAIANDFNALIQSDEMIWTNSWSARLRLPPGTDRPDGQAQVSASERSRLNRAILDETFRGELQSMRGELIREHRFTVKAMVEPPLPKRCDAPAEPDPAKHRVVGFYYRPLIPFTVSIKEDIDREPAGFRLVNSQSSTVYAPDCRRVEPFFLARAQVFARDSYDLRFSGGVLREVSVSRESELLKFAEIPGRILGTVTSLPAELITVNVHHKGERGGGDDPLTSDKESGRTTPRREKE